MEREKLFRGLEAKPGHYTKDSIPESLKKQNDEIQAYRKEQIKEKEEELRKLEESYALMPGDGEGPTDKGHARNRILELKVELEIKKEMVRVYDEDPSLNASFSPAEREEIKRRIMEEMGYSQRDLENIDKYIDSLKKREANQK